jgi:hypothetical protein
MLGSSKFNFIALQKPVQESLMPPRSHLAVISLRAVRQLFIGCIAYGPRAMSYPSFHELVV